MNFEFNGDNLFVRDCEPYLTSNKIWYKPWTWFRDPNIILPATKKITLVIDDDNIIKHVSVDDTLVEMVRKLNVCIDEKKLHLLRG